LGSRDVIVHGKKDGRREREKGRGRGREKKKMERGKRLSVQCYA